MEKIISVRTATIHDLDDLYRFEQGVINTERPFDPTLQEGHINYYDIIEMIYSTSVELVVAETEGRIIASGYARIMQPKIYFKHTVYAYLGFMFVDEKYRGLGVNQKIIEALKTWVRSENITEMRLNVYTKNIGAIRAYEKVGFSEHMVEMRMSLNQ